MGFNYQKNKDHEQHGNPWTSYSDLFMGLAFVFLLLYVVASLRTSTTSIQQKIEMGQINLKNEDLKNQLKIYESLKSNYMEEEASDDEQKSYTELMDKLDLLQEKAKTEKESLKKAAHENEKKEMALNKYQQMIRNIINSNVIAKTRIKKRDDIIDKKDDEIGEQTSEIKGLKSTVAQKQAMLNKVEKQIEDTNDKLAKKMKELRYAYNQQNMSKKAYEEQVERLKQDAGAKVAKLKSQTEVYQTQLSEIKDQLDSTKGTLSQVENEKQRLAGEVANKEADMQAQAEKLRGEFAQQRANDQKAFDSELRKQQLSASEKAAKEAEFRARSAAKEKKLEDQINGLRGNLAGTEKELAQVKAERDTRKAVANEIKKGFARAGVAADVNAETGDVVLDFGDHYFETNRADIKPKMAEILKKAIPVYAASLLDNKKVADKVNGIEIIGFASPTYKGRVVDPSSLDAEDRKAAEYNLDLSYQRAKSIFQYVYDPREMNFDHQKQLRALTKVSGKSFFDSVKIDRSLASTNVKQFCKQVDCKKSQRVLIKFTVNQAQRSAP